MDLTTLQQELTDLAALMDVSIDSVHTASTRTQALIYQLLLDRLSQFDTTDGAFTLGQPVAQKIAKIQQEMYAIIGRYYSPSIRQYLTQYDVVEDRNVYLHESYNELLIKKSLLSSARRTVYDQAEYYLLDGIADAYVQPAKYLLMQAVSNGISLKDANSLLKNWNDGELTAGSKSTSDRPTPRLQAYSTQIARDSLYGYQGSIQEVIKKEYGLTNFMYVGALVKDSRPFCQHLVSLKRKISIEEVPKLVERYPQGLKPNTTKKNFLINRGGFNCNHLVMAVR